MVNLMKIAHIYASNAKMNSGDYMLGISTKWYIKHNIFKNKEIIFQDFDCRNSNLFNNNNINKLNNFDIIMVGGGGLILPDSSPNKNSAWQWNISIENMKKIIKPIYVISIGYNLFYNQDMTMQNRDNNNKNLNILPIFKQSITTLIKCATYFSMRHQGDINSLLQIIGNEYKDKIKFQQCPSVDYVKNVWKPKIKMNNRKYIGIEIKDDREWRRYYKIGKNKYYNELLKIIKYLIDIKKDVIYLSHDGSLNFYNFLKNNKINIPLLNNNSGNENKILNNYSQIHTLLCSAGHSQMISYGLGVRTISLISHPKLKYFCDDFQLNEYIEINNHIEENEIFEMLKKYFN